MNTKTIKIFIGIIQSYVQTERIDCHNANSMQKKNKK